MTISAHEHNLRIAQNEIREGFKRIAQIMESECITQSQYRDMDKALDLIRPVMHSIDRQAAVYDDH